MTYTFAKHLDVILAGANQVISSPFFALVDLGQLMPLTPPLQQLLAEMPGECLFPQSFGTGALELSPRLVRFDEHPAKARDQAMRLDIACQHLPVFSMIGARMGPTQLLTHLRNFLTVEADGDLYLTRMADTQMLHGLVEAMTPLQRSWLFSGVVAWWIVDHDGLLHDLAQDADGPRLPPTDGRFQMQEEQIFALLRSTEIAALASQLRNLEASFGLTLSHARQCTFAAEIDREAKLEACDDGERLSLALDRWRAVQSQGVANV